MRKDPNGAGPVAQGRDDRDRCTACGAWARTTSTCTRSTASDYTTPVEETLEALHDVVKAGKARYIGASSMYAWQFAKALHVADMHTAGRGSSAMQNHLQSAVPRGRARDAAALCAEEGIGGDSVEPAGARAAHA
jgi:aryl-alcohol dehydrogenase-like predicted oxidoreductase